MEDMVIRFRTYDGGTYIINVKELCELAGKGRKTKSVYGTQTDKISMTQAKKLLKFMRLYMTSEEDEKVQQYVREHNPKLYAAVYD